jgi:hypothetical protein
MVKTTLSLRKISLTAIVVVILMVVTMTMSSTVFSTAARAHVAFGERMVIDSEQLVTVSTTNGIDQNNNNNNTIDRHISSPGITQSPENGLGADCEGDLICDIWGNNTLVATNTVGNTTNTTVITDALDTLNQSLTQSLNQSSIPLQLFGEIDFDDMLNNDSGVFNEREDLDSEMDEWIDRMVNETLGDLQAPLQTSPDLLPVSV